VNAPILVFDSAERWRPVSVPLSLAVLGAKLPPGFPDTGTPESRIDFPPDLEPPNLPPTAYVETIGTQAHWWRRYWFWYPHNPKRYAGFGDHEGDWELIQIGYSRHEPALVTVSRHKDGGGRGWSSRQLEKHGERPVIYVALGSHAHYFRSGKIATDRCDGKGERLEDYLLQKPGAWWRWPGRWGNSTGRGQSPQSPGLQRRDPERFHAQAD
jgi:hypothetical protein